MNDLLDRYGALLREVDDWFQNCAVRYPTQIYCHQGCSSCCRGLFDITLLDAFYLRRGAYNLPKLLLNRIKASCSERMELLWQQFPLFKDAWILNGLPETEWDLMMPEDDETPCPLLSDSGVCLVYEHRPMTCRLNGIPMIDVSGEELFDEWCTLNFTDSDPLSFLDIRFRFTELFAQELLLFQEFIRILTGKTLSEVDTVIPAAILVEPDNLVPVIRKMADQSTETTKLPTNPLRS